VPSFDNAESLEAAADRERSPRLVEVVADRIFVGHFFINPSLEFSNIDAGPLQIFFW
jgi:hypothetical protein